MFKHVLMNNFNASISSKNCTDVSARARARVQLVARLFVMLTLFCALCLPGFVHVQYAYADDGNDDTSTTSVDYREQTNIQIMYVEDLTWSDVFSASSALKNSLQVSSASSNTQVYATYFANCIMGLHNDVERNKTYPNFSYQSISSASQTSLADTLKQTYASMDEGSFLFLTSCPRFADAQNSVAQTSENTNENVNISTSANTSTNTTTNTTTIEDPQLFYYPLVIIYKVPVQAPQDAAINLGQESKEEGNPNLSFYAYSTTTQKPGLVVSDDVNAWVNNVLQIEDQETFASPLYLCGTSTLRDTQANPYESAEASEKNLRISSEEIAEASLEDSAKNIHAIESTKDYFLLILVCVFAIAFICAGIAFLLVWLTKSFKNVVRALQAISKMCWHVLLALPPATLLMFAFSSLFTNGEQALLCECALAAALALLALVVEAVAKRKYAVQGAGIMLLLALEVLLAATDQLIGGPWSACGYLSYAPTGISRYFGIGNESACALFASWVAFCALVIQNVHSEKSAHIWKTYIFPLGALAIIFIVALPSFGANFGIAVWGTLGTLFIWAQYIGVKLTWKKVLVSVCVIFVLAFVYLVADATFNSNSHMGSQLNLFSGNFFNQLVQVGIDFWSLSLPTITYSPVLTALFGFVLCCMLCILFSKKTPMYDFFQQYACVRISFAGILVASLFMFLVEDSGIMMPAVAYMYALALQSSSFIDLGKEQ